MTGEHDHHTGHGDLRPPDPRLWASPRPGGVPYRVSDLERDEAITALGDAYAEGRLDHEEFDARLEAATRAVFGSDLDPLFADLPRALAVQAPIASAPRRRAPARRPGHRGPPVGVLLFLFALAVVTHAWLLIPLAFVLAGHRRRRWAPRSPLAPRAVGCGPGAGGHWGAWR